MQESKEGCGEPREGSASRRRGGEECKDANGKRRIMENEAGEIRTPNLLIWSQTRYRCAIAPMVANAEEAHHHKSRRQTVKQRRQLAQQRKSRVQWPGKEGKLERVEENWSRGVTVSTLDSESSAVQICEGPVCKRSRNQHKHRSRDQRCAGRRCQAGQSDAIEDPAQARQFFCLRGRSKAADTPDVAHGMGKWGSQGQQGEA